MEEAIYRSPGHCMVMGTASTMSVICEALGMTLAQAAQRSPVLIPGAASSPNGPEQPPSNSSNATPGHRKSSLEEAFENAALSLLALGGSTNAIIHLTAIAGRAGIEFPLSRVGGTLS